MTFCEVKQHNNSKNKTHLKYHTRRKPSTLIKIKMESLLSGVAPPSLVVLVFTDAGEAVLENTSYI